MNRYLMVTAGAMAAIVVGYLREWSEQRRLSGENEFLAAYKSKFVAWRGSVGEGTTNDELLSWLNRHVIKATALVGELAMVSYKPPTQSYFINNMNVLFNALSMVDNPIMWPQVASHAVSALDQQIGLSEELLGQSNLRLRNPLQMLRLGLQTIGAMPLLLLGWLQVLPPQQVREAEHSWIARVWSVTFFLLSLLASIITVANGWDDFLKLLPTNRH